MANLNYRPGRGKVIMTDEEAYDQLPITLQRCLQEAVTAWCAYSILKFYNKHGLSKTIDEVHRWDENEMARGVQMRPFKKRERWGSAACKVKPLRLYNIKRTTRVGAEIRSVR